MTKMTKLALAALLGLAVVSTTASADAAKGKKIYMKKMKAACGMSGAKFAAKHTQSEWEKIKGAGKFAEEKTSILTMYMILLMSMHLIQVTYQAAKHKL